MSTEFCPVNTTNLNQPFCPAHIGDPVGKLQDVHSVGLCTVWGLPFSTFLIALFMVLWFSRKRCGHSRRLLLLFIPAGSALASLLFCIAAHFYYGGPYCYSNYKAPSIASDVVIWFSGSDDGAYGCQYLHSAIDRSTRLFGYGHVALFNFRDIDEALKFSSRIPEGSRIIVYGHSMGGASAVRFACRCHHPILLLDTRDPTSWFGHIHEKPENVRHWQNILPGVTGLTPPRSEHPETNYWGRINMANVFRLLGRPWGKINGAHNITIPSLDHHECGNSVTTP